MCQISVVIEHDEGNQEKVMDNVTGLDVLPDGIRLSSFFDEPKKVTNVGITSIDFLGGKVVLGKSSSRQPE